MDEFRDVTERSMTASNEPYDRYTLNTHTHTRYKILQYYYRAVAVSSVTRSQ